MLLHNLPTTQYAVCGLADFSLDEATRLWKSKFESFKHFKRDAIKHPALEEFGQFIEEMWETIKPITVQEALLQPNIEKRRIMFNCIGVSRLFKELDPELLDKQIIAKVRTRWDTNNEPYQYKFEDKYELYRIEGHKLFPTLNSVSKPSPVYAVRCWCTTTNREYWIYVPEDIALGRETRQISVLSAPDAIRAIAWTIRIDISHPKRIFRQGDIVVAEESEHSVTITPYHLTKEQYLNLMYSET